MAAAPYQDNTLAGTEVLVRRIHPSMMKADGAVSRPSRSSSFSSSSSKHDVHRGCSCDIRSMMAKPPDDVTWFPDSAAVVGVTVADVRAIDPNLRVGRDPVPGNAAHASIWQVDAAGAGMEISLSNRRKLLAKCFLIRPIDGSVAL